jgi:hypothetical protein
MIILVGIIMVVKVEAEIIIVIVEVEVGIIIVVIAGIIIIITTPTTENPLVGLIGIRLVGLPGARLVGLTVLPLESPSIQLGSLNNTIVHPRADQPQTIIAATTKCT